MYIKKRRHRRNYRRGNRRQVIAVSLCLAIFVFILGTAYSAFSTNLSINASGEIKEHTYTIEDLKNLVVTSGDGLYVDSTEEGRYIYKGGDPYNYILLGDDLFRIIAIESDGTLKVISNESIGNMVFDPSYETVISDSILTTEINSTEGTRYSSSESDYCYASSASSYYGCNVWGSNETTLDSDGNSVETMYRVVNGDKYDLPDTEAYINKYLNDIYYDSLENSVQGVIETHIFNVGNVSYTSGQVLLTDVLQEKVYKWKGKIGLLNVTDYVKATTNTECAGAYDYWTSTGCYGTASLDNWLYGPNVQLWTISPDSASNPAYVWYIRSSGNLLNSHSQSSFAVFPVFYLSSSIVFYGSGDEYSPYEIYIN